MRSGGRGRRLGAGDRAVLDTLLPAGADPLLPLGLLDSGFEQFLSEFDRDAADNLRQGFAIALFAASWAGPLLIGRLPPLRRLATRDRVRALEAMERSRLVVLPQLLRVLKTVAALHYGALPEVRRSIGYHA
jgi:hypothetical protein